MSYSAAADGCLRIIGIAGSLRGGSYNRALLRAAQGLAPATIRIDVADLAEIPMFNADVDTRGTPAAVTTLRAAIRAADGLLLVTPEYNHGVPGVLKNAIDWLSQPLRGERPRGQAHRHHGRLHGTCRDRESPDPAPPVVRADEHAGHDVNPKSSSPARRNGSTPTAD